MSWVHFMKGLIKSWWDEREGGDTVRKIAFEGFEDMADSSHTRFRIASDGRRCDISINTKWIDGKPCELLITAVAWYEFCRAYNWIHYEDSASLDSLTDLVTDKMGLCVLGLIAAI